MSEKSGSESSFNDWCFVSSQSSSSMSDTVQSINKKFELENQETDDAKDEATGSQNDSFPTVQDTEPNEILKLENFNESKCSETENHELSEGNSDSSSDVEILDEPAALNSLTSSGENSDISASFLGGSFSISASNSSDSTLVKENVTECPKSPKPESSPSQLDKKTQTFQVASHRPDWTSRINNYREWLYHQYEANFHNVFVVQAIFFGVLAVFVSIYLVKNANSRSESAHLEASLNKIQSSIVQCFGEQHLEGLRRGDRQFLSSPMCAYNGRKYTEIIQSFLDPEVKSFLITGLYVPEDTYYVSFEDSHDELSLDVIISQLQFLKLLPTLESTDDGSVEETNDQAKGSEQAEQFKTDDLVIAKNEAYQPPTNEPYENMDLNSYNKLMVDLNAEMALLHIEKLKLQKKIEEKQHACTSQTSCSTVDKVHATEKTTTQLEEEQQQKASQEQDNTAEKIKPYLDDLASVLSGEILNLHNSLVNELKEVKKWNELLKNITTEARNPSPQSEGGNWSWQEIRENVENIVLEAHQDFKEKISAFQIQNFTETVQNIVEDNKKNAEYLLNVVNSYYNAVKEKTQSILETPMPEIEVDSTVTGFWNIMNKLQDKWHYVKKEVKQMAKKFRKQHNGYQESKDAFGPETASENWYFKRPVKRTNVYNDDGPHSKSDWLFKRAAQRAKHHRKITKDQKKFA